MAHMLVEEDSPESRPFLLALSIYKSLKVVPSNNKFFIEGVYEKYQFIDGIVSSESDESQTLTVGMSEEEATAMLERLTARLQSGELQHKPGEEVHSPGNWYICPRGWHERRAEAFRKAIAAKAASENAV